MSKNKPSAPCRMQVPEYTTLREAEQIIKEQRIAYESLLAAFDKVYSGPADVKKKISSLTKQLRKHIEEGYPLPDPAVITACQGAPITVILERLADECLRIRLSNRAFGPSRKNTKDAMESEE